MRVSMRFAVIITLIAMGMTTLSLNASGPASAQAAAKRYIVVGAGNTLPGGFEALINAAGGQVVSQLDEIGVAVVESADPGFAYAAGGIAGVQGVAEDRAILLAPPDVDEVVVAESLDPEAAQIEGQGGVSAMFFPVQWNLKNIGVPAAWNAKGKGDPRVKVALLDTGIDYGHVDLRGKVDMDPTHSKSFIPEPVLNGTAPFMDMNGHGTHVAGIIAGNGKFIAGIAPQVTLIAVKVADKTGTAKWSTILPGILHAANVGADIINMSFGGCLVKNGRVDPNDPLFGKCDPGSARDKDKLLEGLNLIAALNRAVNYAHDKGALLVASTGNDSINWDRAGNVMKLPAQLPHVVAVSATGPQFGQDQTSNNMAVCLLASCSPGTYSDYGMSIVSLAAPGGSATTYRPPITLINPNNGKPVTINWPLDWITSTCSRAVVGCSSGSGVQARVGTSMAAAHVTGVAALIDSAAGGTLSGDQIMNILMQSADDFGKPGKDEWYGFGRINAYLAVTGK